ncbi:MAG: RecQ family ATP-dependent DNA helicase, partial [Synechococcales bacterium]|nr:RecQ family ATP-dependent DNA helicase [Synechococcales bacterium]
MQKGDRTDGGTVECGDRARSLLQQFWGYGDFREGQAEIVEALRSGRDALIVMPTGGGKSICFQVPALLQPGLTIVLSPLVALMENQVQELRDRKIPAALLHSQLERSQRQRILQAVEQQRLKLLYLSPETLLSPAVWQLLCQPQVQISCLVLDEAHCLSQWGDSFRPTYFRLGAVRSALLQHKPAGSHITIAAFTATADPTAQATITHILRLQNPQLFKQNPFRPNLAIQIQRVWTPHDRRHQLLQFIQSRKNSVGQPSAGLVYVRSRQDSEDLALWLRQQNYQTAAYHAGLTATERRQIEQNWISDRLQFVVSTNAFGMGVNKPNVRWVVHYHLPLLLSEYVQEIGRAGRDGQPAQVLSLASESTGWLDPADRQRWQFFQQQSQQQRDRAKQLLKKLPNA